MLQFPVSGNATKVLVADLFHKPIGHTSPLRLNPVTVDVEVIYAARISDLLRHPSVFSQGLEPSNTVVAHISVDFNWFIRSSDSSLPLCMRGEVLAVHPVVPEATWCTRCPNLVCNFKHLLGGGTLVQFGSTLGLVAHPLKKLASSACADVLPAGTLGRGQAPGILPLLLWTRTAVLPAST